MPSTRIYMIYCKHHYLVLKHLKDQYPVIKLIDCDGVRV